MAIYYLMKNKVNLFPFSITISIITPIKAIIPKGILHKIKNGAIKINNKIKALIINIALIKNKIV